LTIRAKDYEWVRCRPGLEFSAILSAGIHSLQKKEAQEEADAAVEAYKAQKAREAEELERKVALGSGAPF